MNLRTKYVENFLGSLANWGFADKNFEQEAILLSDQTTTG